MGVHRREYGVQREQDPRADHRTAHRCQAKLNARSKGGNGGVTAKGNFIPPTCWG